MSHILHYLFWVLLFGFMLLSQSVSAAEPARQEGNEMAVRLIPAMAMLLTDMTVTQTGVSSTLKKTGQTKSYHKGDDGYYQKGLTPNYIRNRTTNIITDRIRGLQWQDDVAAKTVTKNWKAAQKYCKTLRLGGGGWRLPTRKELIDLSHYGKIDPAIHSVFANVANVMSHKKYWTSTNDAGSSAQAWYVNFHLGDQDIGNKNDDYYVRCVRTKQ